MNTVRQFQLEAAEDLAKSVKRIDYAIETLKDLKNPFDIEARLYVIETLMKSTARLAGDHHKHIHALNSLREGVL